MIRRNNAFIIGALVGLAISVFSALPPAKAQGLPTALSGTSGVTLDTTQTITGAKTFSSSLTCAAVSATTVAASGTITSSVASGSNGYSQGTGTRLKVGGHADDWIATNGLGRVWSEQDYFGAANGFFFGNGTDTSGLFYSNSAAIAYRAYQTQNSIDVHLHQFGNNTSLSRATSKIAAFYNDDNTTERFSINLTGKPNFHSSVSGTATLVNGTVTVSTTSVETGSRIFLSLNTAAGATQGVKFSAPVASIVDNTSFVIYALDAAGVQAADDDSTVNWLIAN